MHYSETRLLKDQAFLGGFRTLYRMPSEDVRPLRSAAKTKKPATATQGKVEKLKVTPQILPSS